MRAAYDRAPNATAVRSEPPAIPRANSYGLLQVDSADAVTSTSRPSVQPSNNERLGVTVDPTRLLSAPCRAAAGAFETTTACPMSRCARRDAPGFDSSSARCCSPGERQLTSDAGTRVLLLRCSSVAKTGANRSRRQPRDSSEPGCRRVGSQGPLRPNPTLADRAAAGRPDGPALRRRSPRAGTRA